MSPRRIKDKFSLVFSKFSQIALVATRLGQFCENFENTRENLSLILLGLMRLHIQIQRNLAWSCLYKFFSINEELRSVVKEHFNGKLFPKFWIPSV